MIDGKNFFHRQINNAMRSYKNITKIISVQGDDYTAGCLLYYTYFEKYH